MWICLCCVCPFFFNSFEYGSTLIEEKKKPLEFDIYTEQQKKPGTEKYNSQFSLHLFKEIVYMCNDKILVQQ